uniref:Uncharacterized protein n=1 Tax=Arundo donax TaxID=35708 RepID=A0A0A9C2V0_ARUDO
MLFIPNPNMSVLFLKRKKEKKEILTGVTQHKC